MVAHFQAENPPDLYDFPSLEQVMLFHQLLDVGIALAFQNPRNLPIAVAEHPSITISGVLAALDSGVNLGGAGSAYYYSTPISLDGIPGVPCGTTVTCPSFEAMAYYDDRVALSVIDGRMLYYALPMGMDPLDLLDLIAAQPPTTDSDDPEKVRANSIAFFRIMNESFGIPTEAMEIYAYDRMDLQRPVEESWPTEYLSVYWGESGDLVVPRVTTEEPNDLRDTVEAYDLRVIPLDSPYTFRRWRYPLEYSNRLQEPPDTELELQSRNCPSGPVCAFRLFDDQYSRDQYYAFGNFPFEAIQMAVTPGTAGEVFHWSVAYLTNEPLLLVP